MNETINHTDIELQIDERLPPNILEQLPDPEITPPIIE
jgi:hypothetical protein